MPPQVARSARASAPNESRLEDAQPPGAPEKYWSPLQDLIDRTDFRILQQILPSTPGWFVEIGSGWGRLLPAYDRPDREIVLVDSHLGLLETARQTHRHRNLHLIRADAYRLPFRPGAFAAGLCVRAFPELTEPDALLREFARVLRPDARFVLSYANKRNLLRILRRGRCCFQHGHEPAGDKMFVTHPRYLEQLLAPAGLSQLRAQSSGLVEQLLRPGRLYSLARALPFFLPLFVFADRPLSAVLGPLGLLPHTFLLLGKQAASPAAAPVLAATPGLAGILACPVCRSFPLTHDPAADACTCSHCARRFPRRRGVWDFTNPAAGQ
jgi:SAM-dependent methyltransferase